MPIAMLHIQGFEPTPFMLGSCQLCIEYLLAVFQASAGSADMCLNVKADLACPSEHTARRYSIGEALSLANV